MEIDLIIYIAFIAFILLMFFYVRVVTNDLNEKLNGVLKAVDDSFKDLHSLRKEMMIVRKSVGSQSNQKEFNDNIMQNCELLINSIIDERINELNSDLGLIQESMQEATRNQNDRIANLELANEPAIKLRPDNGAERMQILKLYEEGRSIDEIAQMLNKSPLAVNLVLKSL